MCLALLLPGAARVISPSEDADSYCQIRSLTDKGRPLMKAS